MNDLLTGAWILFDQFKTDTTPARSSREGGGSNDISNSTSNNRRSGYNPNQSRGGDGRWVESGTDNRRRSEEQLFDPNSATGRAHARKLEEEANKVKLEESKPKLKDVEETDLGRGGFAYSHTTKENNKLDVSILPVGDGKSKVVDFSINDSFDKDDKISSEESNRISIKIAKILQYDASRREDGEQYQTSAYTDDSDEYGAVRAYAYERIAKFSRPSGGEAGGYQYAVVKNGKLEPDMKRVREEEFDLRITEEEAEEAASEYRQTAENYRKQKKT